MKGPVQWRMEYLVTVLPRIFAIVWLIIPCNRWVQHFNFVGQVPNVGEEASHTFPLPALQENLLPKNNG